jgi:hypothetical protein
LEVQILAIGCAFVWQDGIRHDAIRFHEAASRACGVFCKSSKLYDSNDIRRVRPFRVEGGIVGNPGSRNGEIIDYDCDRIGPTEIICFYDCP